MVARRNKYKAEFKAQVALEALSGERPTRSWPRSTRSIRQWSLPGQRRS